MPWASHPVIDPPPVSPRYVLVLALIAGCQGKSEPDPPRPPRPVIEARNAGAAAVRIVAGHPCRAEIEGNELLVGSEPLVAQVGAARWSGAQDGDSIAVRRDQQTIVRFAERADTGVELLDPSGGLFLHISADGVLANARGEVLRRAEASRGAIKIGDSIVTGTNDLALGVLITAPELIPEVRALAACQRLFTREQASRK